MNIATILPYKENYTSNGAGAVSLWIKDFMRDSKYKKNVSNYFLSELSRLAINLPCSK